MHLRVVALDSPRTAEDQLCLANDQLHRVWNAWCTWTSTRDSCGDGRDQGIEKLDETFKELEDMLRRCCQVSHETDVFISGLISGRKK